MFFLPLFSFYPSTSQVFFLSLWFARRCPYTVLDAKLIFAHRSELSASHQVLPSARIHIAGISHQVSTKSITYYVFSTIFVSTNVYISSRLSFHFGKKMQCWFPLLPILKDHVISTCHLSSTVLVSHSLSGQSEIFEWKLSGFRISCTKVKQGKL